MNDRFDKAIAFFPFYFNLDFGGFWFLFVAEYFFNEQHDRCDDLDRKEAWCR